MEQKAGTAAILSILAALGSFILSFSGRPGWGLIAGIVSLPLGFFGLIRAASPRVSGGIMSIIAMILGVLAIGIAVLVLIGVILF